MSHTTQPRFTFKKLPDGNTAIKLRGKPVGEIQAPHWINGHVCRVYFVISSNIAFGSVPLRETFQDDKSAREYVQRHASDIVALGLAD